MRYAGRLDRNPATMGADVTGVCTELDSDLAFLKFLFGWGAVHGPHACMI